MSINISCEEIISLTCISRIKYDFLNHKCHMKLNIIYDWNINWSYILTPIVLTSIVIIIISAALNNRKSKHY
jgi:CBS-domain-containing membrane protein